MSIFREVNKISITTVALAVLTIVIGYAATLMEDPIATLEVMVIAVALLVLFFYSLLRDRISQLERDKNAPAG